MEKRNSFKGSIGFVLAAAGSAVGLGNIWRFPYLAAKDGGGLFLLVYIILALTFGFTLLTTEVAIGRKTKKGPLSAYNELKKGWKALGVGGCLVPVIIMPYYCAIGGWVLKYCIAYLTGHGSDAAQDGYFTGFITSTVSPVVYMAIFMAICAFVVYKGVNKGIETMSRVIMPALLVLAIIIAVYSISLKMDVGDGTIRTGVQGLGVYVIPKLDGLGIGTIMSTIFDAMGQLFYSLSVAMGIMVAYGSYVKDEDNLVKSIGQIEFFDTIVAFLAGVMIVPAVYVFMGSEGMSASGPSLMFVILPKVFSQMGVIGNLMGALFFFMVLFAALTSGVSIMEAIVSSTIDEFHFSRNKSVVVEFVLALVLGIIVCFGYNIMYFEVELPNGSVGQILDIFDYFSNNILMPIVAIATCILIGWVLGPKTIINEVERNGENFHRKGLYIVMIKFIAPILLLILFIGALVK